MNRFRTKKKAKDDLSAATRSSEESEQSSRAFFRSRKKTQQEEIKPEFDLATALPSTDDFRTSLLMSNLSARFSMLREQDDPNSKIGKASDDSVLYPKRQSRMADFGFSSGIGLSDIAEVESIKAPFLRKDSFASDDTDLKGSVMNRAKPTEGNNLFGGRQKIYKIPAGAKSSGGGMTGRALYDDDVAMSAFQRWRAAERERSRERSEAESDQQEEDDEPARSASPGLNPYNRKRETASTTSSASTMARNSTAATSINSQIAGSIRESQASATPASATATSNTAGPERLVTKAKRLYEQGLTQNMQEQQSSALSRIDTLTGKKPFGARAADLASNAPSPTTIAALDRPLTERRAMLAKASAPSLRSASPVTTSTSTSSTNLGINVPAQPEVKPSFGGAPPLSPPISETGEVPILPIQPNDIGKATALGMFQKPSQPYDESKYAQRQIQLQQGRETPTQKFRSESDDLSRSQSSSSSASQPPFKAKTEPIKTQIATQDAGLPPTPIPDSAVPPSTIPSLVVPSSASETNLQRPSDEDHPAFRQSAMPTPLSISSRVSDEPSPISEQLNVSLDNPANRSPIDSPTLGDPAATVPAGLSGMVRQHLRSESNASSIYDEKPQASGFESRFNSTALSPTLVHDLAPQSNPWMNSGHEWAVSYYGNSADKSESRAKPREETSQETKPLDRTSNITEEEEDEFASQLADARRRVREKLTSYVESDSSRAASPQPQSERELAASTSSPSLGFGILKSKSSLGSIVDRSRGVAATQSKTMKMLGVNPPTVGTSQPAKHFFDEKELSTLGTMKEEGVKNETQETRVSSDSANDGELGSGDKEDGMSSHPGLKAFRQAKRELQRRKELETLARHQASQTSHPKDQSADQASLVQPPPRADRGANQRAPSGDRRPPPVTYRPRAPSDEGNYSNTPQRSGDRDRSGSESNGKSQSRPPRLRTGPQDQLAPGNARPPMMRSPGLPGTDIKGSPIMPPHPYPVRGVPSPGPSPLLNQSRSVGNLALHTSRLGFDHPSGQPSPVSPMALPSPAPYAAGAPGSPIGTPTSLGPRNRQSSLAHSPALGPVNGMRRPVDKREISEPTLLSSTTRLPVLNLPHQRPPMGSDAGDRGRAYPEPRSRSSSRGNGPAPPVPPINPRRRRDDSRPRQLEQDDNKSAFASEDETAKDYRRRLRKINPSPSDSQVPPGPRSAGARGRDNSPPYLAKGLPARVNPGMGPGGMI